MRGTAVPASGTGAFRVGGRRAVAVDSRGAPAEAVAAAPAPAAAPARIALPALGTEGDIFSNLVQFQRDAATAAGGIASARGQARAGKAATELGVKRVELGLKAEDVFTNRMKAITDQDKAGAEGRKVVLDLQGNPIIVDTKASTAVQPPVRKVPSEAEFLKAAMEEPRNKGLSNAQLRDYYRRTYIGG